MKYTKEELRKWWAAKCPKCGWTGLSRSCVGENNDLRCPVCLTVVEDDD